MKTRFLTILPAILLMLALSGQVQAQQKPGQDPARQERMEKIESARTAYISDKINLTPDQAQKFWPLYNEYNAKRKELRHKARSFKNGNFETMTDKELKDGIDNMFDNRQAELNLEKSYSVKFQKVISVRQLAQLYKAEREFTRLLLRRLEEKNTAKK